MEFRHSDLVGETNSESAIFVEPFGRQGQSCLVSDIVQTGKSDPNVACPTIELDLCAGSREITGFDVLVLDSNDGSFFLASREFCELVEEEGDLQGIGINRHVETLGVLSSGRHEHRTDTINRSLSAVEPSEGKAALVRFVDDLHVISSVAKV